MTTATTKVARVRVSYTGYDWNDTYTMTSPTGKTLRVRPNGHWSHSDSCPADRRLTEEEEQVLENIQSLYQKDPLTGEVRYWGDVVEVPATHEEMRLFMSASRKTS